MIYGIEILSHEAIKDISIKPEPIFHIGSFAITNSLFTTWVIMAILIIFAVIFKSRLKMVPGRFQTIIEGLIEAIHNMLDDLTNNKERTRKMYPLIATIFIFVLLSNLSGLIPGAGSSIMVPESHVEAAHAGEVSADNHAEAADTEAAHGDGEEVHGFYHNGMKYVPLFRAPSSDLNMTFALAIVTMLIVQIAGLAVLKFGYLKKFFNFSSVIGFFVGLLELISEFGKVLAFSFRLFGNIFAGEVLLIVMGSFLAIILPMPFYGFELFVAFIQAFVFAILAAAFLNLAMEHHEEEEGKASPPPSKKGKASHA